MDGPWNDPNATGYGRRVDEQEYARFVQRKIDNLRKSPDSLMGKGCPHVMAIIDFADRRKMWVNRDQPKNEIWGLHLEFERVDREIWVIVQPASWFDGWEIDVCTMATWVAEPPLETYRTRDERRWYGTSTAAPAGVLSDTLELALQDGKSYSLTELIPWDIWLKQTRLGSLIEARRLGLTD